MLPTTDFAGFETVAKLAEEDVDGAKVLGIHSEGPYLNRVGEKGVDTGTFREIDLDELKQNVAKAHGKLKSFAIAPELPKAREAIEYLTREGVRVAFAHSNMMLEESQRSVQLGHYRFDAHGERHERDPSPQHGRIGRLSAER